MTVKRRLHALHEQARRLTGDAPEDRDVEDAS